MSDYKIAFIPEQPDFIPAKQTIRRIKALRFDENDVQNVRFEINEQILFADCGSNLEAILCPFCNIDLMEWWGEAMSKAYTDAKGFADLAIYTPCCHKASSLNNLKYHFNQGFYKSKLTVTPQLQHHLAVEEIAQQLEHISGVSWRIIHQHI